MSGRRNLIPISFNGVMLNTIGRQAEFDYDEGAYNTPAYDPVAVERMFTFPSHVGVQPHAKVFPLRYTILSHASESQFNAITSLLNPANGLGLLEVEDGDGVRKQVECVPQQVITDQKHDKPLVVPMYAPNPILHSVALHSTVDIIDASPAMFGDMLNAGTYETLPTFELVPTTAKGAHQGYVRMYEITYVSRSEFPLTGPASNSWLIDVTNNGWDTAGIISIAAGSTTISADSIGAGDVVPFILNVADASAFDDFGLIVITPGANEEQFVYQKNSPTILFITARAQGGTTAQNHANGATVRQSRMFKDGRDIAVLIDNVQVPPEKVNIVGINTATTKIFIEIADIPMHTSTLTAAITAGSTELHFITAKHGFKVGDYLTWLNTSALWEQGRVTGVDEEIVTLQRAVRATTAGAAAIGAEIFKVQHHLQVAWYYTQAPARPTNPDPPLINLATSTNSQWEWTTAPIWAEASRRAGGWRRILFEPKADVPSLAKNRLASKIGLDISGSNVRFIDVEPSALQPNFDGLQFDSPCGIDDAAGAIEYNSTVPWIFALQIVGRDLLGYETLLVNRLGHDVATGTGRTTHRPPTTYTNQQETPPNVLQSIVMRAKNMFFTGAFFSVAPPTVRDLSTFLDPFNDWSHSVRVDDKDVEIIGIVLKARKQTAGAATLNLRLHEENTEQRGQPKTASNASLIGTIGHSLDTTSYVYICFFSSDNPLVVLPTGVFWVHPYESASSNLQWASGGSALGQIYQKGYEYQYDGTDWDIIFDKNDWFALLTLVNDNQDVGVRTAEQLLLSNILIKFDPNRTPIVQRQAEEVAYYFNNTFMRDDMMFRVQHLRRWADANGRKLTVDTNARTITEEYAAGYSDSVRPVLMSDQEPWLSLPAGLSETEVEAEYGAQAEQVTMTYRDAWQA